MRTARRLQLLIALAALAAALAGAAQTALAAGTGVPYWQAVSSSVPSNLKPGGVGRILVTADNLGDAPTTGTVSISDKLPPGLTLKKGGFHGVLANEIGTELAKESCDEATLTCSYTQPLQPGTGLELLLEVEVGSEAGATPENEVTLSGGGAPPYSSKQKLHVSGEEPTFGIEKYSIQPEEEGGGADTRAGSHPFQLTTVLGMNLNAKEEPVHLPKDLTFQLPPGLLGNPYAVPRCTTGQFTALTENGQRGTQNACPADTAVGTATVTIAEPVLTEKGPETRTVPIFNLEPAPGEPARFGLLPDKVPITLTTAVRTGSDYGVTVTAKNTDAAAGLVATRVQFWGVPGDPRHNAQRGWACAEQGLAAAECQTQTSAAEKEAAEGKTPVAKPFLSLPTSCSTNFAAYEPEATSWSPGVAAVKGPRPEYNGSLGPFGGTLGECGALVLNPTMTITPESAATSTPTGLTTTITLPQEETAEGLAESALSNTTVALPAGMTLNPGAANGLQACTALQIGLVSGPESAQTQNNDFTPTGPLYREHEGEPPTLCEQAPGSKVGDVTIVSPDLQKPLTGFVYLAAEGTNPFEPPLVLYIIAEEPESKVLVKLAGKVTPDPGTGALTTTFENTPQVPFKELKLSFYGGGRSSVATPARCGTYASEATFTPWSGNAAAVVKPTFAITQNCPQGATLPFAPSFNSGSANLQAGAFTPFTLTVGNPDGDQALTGLQVHLPAGMAAMLSSVTPCPIATADAAQCGPESLIGHSTTVSGLGGNPYSLAGSVYLTQGFDGAPFGISVATPAVAGPFNLGTIVADSTIKTDISTAAVTVTAQRSIMVDNHGTAPIGTTPLPTIVKGVPVQLKAVDVTVDRPSFQFNPTNCTPQSITGTLTGSEGASAAVSNRFQVAGCGSLPFNPGLTVEAGGKYSRVNGTYFNVKVTSAPGQANIAKTKLTIPEQLPSRQTTLQKACLAATFNANPASCSPESIIGEGIAHTPVLKAALRGPAYLVSHGGEAFPDVEFVLQGEGIELILDGKTNIHNGITTSEFNAVPDAPVSTFEANLPAGPKSIITGYSPNGESICQDKLSVPTIITGQNGTVIERNTPVKFPDCVAGVIIHHESRAQKYKKALAACRKKYKHNKHKRKQCEATARRRYGPVHKPGKKHSSRKK